MERLALLIPAFNEEASIGALLDEIAALGQPNWQAVVINDASQDSTARVARERGVPLLDLPVNLGIGGAIQAGYRWAEREGYDWALQMDGDGQHDPKMIALLVQEAQISAADMVIGSRFVPGFESAFKSTRLRRLGIRWFSALIGVLCGKRIFDPTSGFRLVNASLIQNFASDYPSDYPEPETSARVLSQGFKVSEIPVQMRARESGRSSIDAGRSLYYMLKVSLGIVLGVASARESRRKDHASP